MKRFMRLWNFLACPLTPARSTSESHSVSLVLDGVGTFHGLTIEQSLHLLQWNNENGLKGPPPSTSAITSYGMSSATEK